MIIRKRLKIRTLIHPVMFQVYGAQRPRRTLSLIWRGGCHTAEATKAVGPIVLENS